MHGSFRIGVLTLSDKGSQGQRVDESGPVVQEMLDSVGVIAQTAILPDDVNEIVALLQKWSDEDRMNLIVTTGRGRHEQPPHGNCGGFYPPEE